MSNKNEVNAFLLKVGLLLGVAFCSTIFIAHLRGISHMPSDSAAWLNSVIFMFVVMMSGRQYRDTVEGANFTFSRAYIYITKLNIVSSLILTVFAYFYYEYISPDDIEEIISLIGTFCDQTQYYTAEQKILVLNSISSESMTFVVFIFQFFGMSLFGLLLANIIKYKKIIIE